MIRWGKAGQRLTDQEIEARSRAAVARRNRRNITRTEDDRIAYRLWRAGELKPYLITHALNARNLYGPEVDKACGASEPDVDLWEAGKLYPTWRQVLLLADLCGVTPRLLCSRREPIPMQQTSLRFHTPDIETTPTVWAFTTEAVQATVAGTPFEMPETDA